MDTIIDELHRRVGCTDDDPTFVIYRDGQIRQAMGHLMNRVEQRIEAEKQKELAIIKTCLEDVLAGEWSGDQEKF